MPPCADTSKRVVRSSLTPFFEQFIAPLSAEALRSRVLWHYVSVDILLALAQYISDQGGDPDPLIGSANAQEAALAKLYSLDQVRAELRPLFLAALAFRDNQAGSDRAALLQKAKEYIETHFSDPGLSLNEVAAQVNFSPNHFSAVFSQETGGTFRDYLTHTRIEQAQKLLRATHLKVVKVAFQCGYNDPHYFSVIFRKVTGLSPQQFRRSGSGISKRE